MVPRVAPTPGLLSDADAGSRLNATRSGHAMRSLISEGLNVLIGSETGRSVSGATCKQSEYLRSHPVDHIEVADSHPPNPKISLCNIEGLGLDRVKEP